MILRRSDASRRSAVPEIPSTVTSIGQSLTAARLRIGLGVDQAAANAGTSVAELEALEHGALDLLPDRIVALRTLRSYADSLGLEGDRYVVALIDCWPPDDAEAVDLASPGPATNGTAVVAAVTGATVVGDAMSTGSGSTGPARPLANSTDPGPVGPIAGDPPSRDPEPVGLGTGLVATAGIATSGPPTAMVPPVTGPEGVRAVPPPVPPPTTWTTSATSPAPIGPSTAQVALVAPVTGVTPAVGPDTPPAGSGTRSPGAAVLVLRSLIAVVLVLIVLGAAGLSLHHWRPAWWAKLHLPAGRVGTPGASAAPSAPVVTTRTGPVVTVVSNNGTTETLRVHATTYAVEVVAVDGRSWLQATDAEHVSPIFAGVLGPGQAKLLAGSQTLTVEVGSSAARLHLLVKQASVGSYRPHAAPYTYVFQLAA